MIIRTMISKMTSYQVVRLSWGTEIQPFRMLCIWQFVDGANERDIWAKTLFRLPVLRNVPLLTNGQN